MKLIQKWQTGTVKTSHKLEKKIENLFPIGEEWLIYNRLAVYNAKEWEIYGVRALLYVRLSSNQTSCIRCFTETFLVWGYLCLGNVPANAIYPYFIRNPTRNLR